MIVYLCFTLKIVFFLNLRPYQQYFSCVGGQFPTHLSWKETVVDSFPPLQTTKASSGNRTHVREITGLEVIDFNHSAMKAVRIRIILTETTKTLPLTDSCT